jgi:LysM repeat protein
MRTARQIILGLIIALASSGIIIGAFSLSFAEQGPSTPAPVTSTFSSPTRESFTASPGPTNTPILVTPTWTLTLPPTPVDCPPPQAWVPYLVQPGDTLDLLATRYNLTTQTISDANCLGMTALLPGSRIYLPPEPTATVEIVSCGPPHGWVTYTVKPGDNLYHLSQIYNITVPQLQLANCLGSSDLIIVGHTIYVPGWAPHTPTPTIFFWVTDTPFIFPTDTPSVTPTETPWIFPTDTRLIAPTDTPSEPPPSETPMPSDTPIPLPSDTPVPFPTDTPNP